MAKSTAKSSAQSSASASAFQSYEDTAHAKVVALKKTEARMKALRGKAFGLDVHYAWVKDSKRFVFSATGQSVEVAQTYEEAKERKAKDITKMMNDYFGSQRISEAREYTRLVLSGELEEVFNTTIKGMKTKEISSVGYLLKLYKKATAPAKEEATAEAETPDVGETEEAPQPQQETVKVPQTEEDFVAIMVERGLDLDKVVELIFDLDKSEKVAVNQ